MSVIPGFGGSPSVPPPPPPKDTDPAILEAQTRLRLAEKRRKGRGSTILTDEATLGDPSLGRPEARGGAKLLGE